MAHKLSISLDRSSDSELDSMFVRIYDNYVRGEDYTISINVKNISSLPFPGGIVKDFWTEYLQTRGIEAHFRQYIKKEVPQLKTGEQQNLGPAPWIPGVEGPGWFKVQVEAVDGQSVEYYREVAGKVELEGSALWYTGFFVINRESVLIAKQLQDLKALLTK